MLEIFEQKSFLIAGVFILAVIGIAFLGKSGKHNQKKHLKQAFIASIGFSIVLVTFFQPWITYNNSIYTGYEISSLLQNVTNVAIFQSMVYFLLFLIMLMITGTLLHAYGYDAGKGLISKCSISFFFITLILLLGLGYEMQTSYRFAPWITLFGAILGRLSLDTAKRETWGKDYDVSKQNQKNKQTQKK